MTGPREPEGWKGADTANVDFYDLKGIVEDLLDGLHVSDIVIEPTEHPYHRSDPARWLQRAAALISAAGA